MSRAGWPDWKCLVWGVLAVGLLFGVGSEAGALTGPGSIEVKGTGFFQDFRLERLLKGYAREGEEDGKLDAATIEDGVVLIRSRLTKAGYLEPEIRLHLKDSAGASSELEVLPGVLPELPLDRAYASVRYIVEPGRRSVYGTVEFEGLETLSRTEALSYFFPQNDLFPSRNRRPYSPEAERSARGNLREALVNAGYREAVVQLEEKRQDEASGAVDLRISVERNALFRVREVREEILGEGSWEENLRGDYAEAVGAVFSPEWSRNVQLRTRIRFYEAGYPDARVTLEPSFDREDDEAGTVGVNVLLTVRPGPRVRVGAIEMSGAERMHRPLIERQVTLESGEWLDRTRLEESRRNLGELSVFRGVRAKLVEAEGGATEIRDVHFLLEERERRDYFLRGGYGSYEKLRLGLEVQQYNLWGRAHRSRLFLGYSMKSRHAEWIYTVPEVFGSRLRWDTSLEWLSREEVSYERNEWSFRSGIDTRIESLDSRLRISYNLERLESRKIRFVDSVGDDRFRSGSIEFTLLRDRLDNPIVPRDGTRVRLTGEHAAELLGSESSFQRYEFNVSIHRDLENGWFLHGRLHHGVVFSLGNPDSSVPFNKRFFPGGENSIRGYGEGEASFRGSDGTFIGSSTITVLSAELERQLFGDLLGVVFFDGLLQGKTENDYPGDTTLGSVGLGLRLNSPVGPVRLEYGHNLNPRLGDPDGAFHFSLGFPF